MKLLPSRASIEDTKMSFGEHLEELRVALWKAVIALAVGFGIGLLVGEDLVRLVNGPLEKALGELEQSQQLRQFEKLEGAAVDGDAALAEEGYVPRRFFVNPEAMLGTLRSLGVEADSGEGLPDRVPLWLWTAPQSAQPMATGVQTVFTVYIKASLVAGIVISSPFVFYFIWSFVAAGLYPHEKRYVHLFLPFSIGLFLFGAIVAFYLVLRYVIAFLFSFNDWLGVEATPRIDEWLSFVLILPVGFGIAFQLPLVMLFLERIGVASVTMYWNYWKYAVLIIFIVSMLLTPADPQSLIAMAGFLTPLYFGGILLCKYLPSRSKPLAERLAD